MSQSLPAEPSPSDPVEAARAGVRNVRREQIVDAAVAIIAERGLQNLSLSAIEERAGMSRGQLTYYFKAKEDILLAVFDRLLQLTYQRIGTPGGETWQAACDASAWEWVEHLLRKLLHQPAGGNAFSSLQYTFLAQMAHRDDFRQRLASLYEEWRGHMAEGFAAQLGDNPRAPAVSPRALASLVQALLHGLSMQLAADPDAFPRDEMLHLCLDMLSNHLRITRGRPRRSAKSLRNGGEVPVASGAAAPGPSPRRAARPATPSREP